MDRDPLDKRPWTSNAGVEGRMGFFLGIILLNKMPQESDGSTETSGTWLINKMSALPLIVFSQPIQGTTKNMNRETSDRLTWSNIVAFRVALDRAVGRGSLTLGCVTQ